MPISRPTKKLRGVVLGSAAALAMAVAWPAGSALSDTNEEFFLQFHSFVPAQKSFKLPKLTTGAVWQDDMQVARDAWRNGKYVQARKHLEQAREKGHVIASWYLGHIYQQGRGVKKNDAKAFKYYREVAVTYEPDAGSSRRTMIIVDSMVRVADVYREGSKSAKVNRDPSRAFGIYSTASGHGHPGAEFGLGVIYLKGLGIRKNPRRALRWLSKSARKRYAPAEALLGELYWEGMYVAKDRTRAITWYLLARQTANPVVHRHVYNRLEEMLLAVSDEERKIAIERATRLSQKHPTKSGILPASD